MHDLPTYDDVIAAAARIAGHANRTPVMSSRTLDEELGAEVFFKCENLQRMGRSSSAAPSTRCRGFPPSSVPPGGGVLLRQPRPGHRPLGALAGDPGDHRDAGRRAGGEDRATRGYGGQVVLYDRYTEDREQIGRDLAQRHGLTLIPPYDHPDVLAGQGHRGQGTVRRSRSAGRLLRAPRRRRLALRLRPGDPRAGAGLPDLRGGAGGRQRWPAFAAQRRHRAYRYAADPRRWRPDPAFGQSHLPADPAQRR